MQIGEIAPAAAGNANLFPRHGAMFDDQNFATLRRRDSRAHHSRRTGTDNQCVAALTQLACAMILS